MADKFFVGDTDNSWSDSDNWSTTSGGTGGAGRPTFSDTAKFDVNSPDCLIDISTGVRGMDFDAGFVNTLTQGNFNFSCNSDSWTQAGGTFIGSANLIEIKGAGSIFRISGGEFRSTSGILLIDGHINFSGGTYTHNDGLLELDSGGSRSIDFGGNDLYDFTCDKFGGNMTHTGTTVVKNDFVWRNTAVWNGGTLQLEGNVDSTATTTTGTMATILTGAGSHTFSIVGWPRGNVICNAGFWDATNADTEFGGSGQDFSIIGTGTFCIGGKTLIVQGDFTDNAPTAHIQKFEDGIITVNGVNDSFPAIVLTCSPSPQEINITPAHLSNSFFIQSNANINFPDGFQDEFFVDIWNIWVGIVDLETVSQIRSTDNLKSLNGLNKMASMHYRDSVSAWYGTGSLS